MNDAITITDNITATTKSASLTARTLPKRYELIFEAVPDTEDITIPRASAADDAMAIAVSPDVLYFRLTYIITNDAVMTDGAAMYIG